MRLLLTTIIFIGFSIIAKGQSVTFVLTHGSSRKWIGVEKTNTLIGPTSTNLIFHGNHKIEEQPLNSYKAPVSQKWQILTGNNIDDENITVDIDGVTYTVVFSKTSNGSDFMTLTYYRNDRAITKAYYSE